MAQSHQCVLSSPSLTELKSVLQRRQREPQISDEVVRMAQQPVMLELAQGSWYYLAIAEPILVFAGEPIKTLQSPIGTLDAIHQPCAKTSRCELMLSADRQLLHAASEAGLQTMDLD